MFSSNPSLTYFKIEGSDEKPLGQACQNVNAFKKEIGSEISIILSAKIVLDCWINSF
jgi:hypothetical protein